MLGPQMIGKNCRRAFVRPPTMATLLHTQDPLEALLNDHVVCIELWVLSLLVEEGICLPLEVWQESWPNFR